MHLHSSADRLRFQTIMHATTLEEGKPYRIRQYKRNRTGPPVAYSSPLLGK